MTKRKYEDFTTLVPREETFTEHKEEQKDLYQLLIEMNARLAKIEQGMKDKNNQDYAYIS